MTAAELLTECNARHIALQAQGGQLDIDAPAGELTDELLQRLREHKAELLTMLQPQNLPSGDRHGADGAQDVQPQDSDAGDWLDVTDPDGRRCLVRSDAADLQVIDLPAPCPVCGGIVFWWDVTGGAHCEHCEPRTRATWLRERAERLPGPFLHQLGYTGARAAVLLPEMPTAVRVKTDENFLGNIQIVRPFPDQSWQRQPLGAFLKVKMNSLRVNVYRLVVETVVVRAVEGFSLSSKSLSPPERWPWRPLRPKEPRLSNILPSVDLQAEINELDLLRWCWRLRLFEFQQSRCDFDRHRTIGNFPQDFFFCHVSTRMLAKGRQNQR